MTIAKKYEDVVAERDDALAREAALREELDSLKRDSEQDTTIDERDRYHEIADSLALAISQHFRVEIGEHSSMNCPWRVALDVMNGAYITDTDEGRERDALQQRLTVAEQHLARAISNITALLVDACPEQFAALKIISEQDAKELVRSMFDRDLSALKPAAEGEGS